MRRELELNEYEILRTRAAVMHSTADAVLGVFVAVAAKVLPIKIAFYAPALLSLTGVVHRLIASRFRKAEQQALEKMEVMLEGSASAGS